MTIADLINWLSVVALIGFIIATILLIVVLLRANKALYRINHLSEIFNDFVAKALPALVNVGTVTTAIHSILQALSEHEIFKKSKSKK